MRSRTDILHTLAAVITWLVVFVLSILVIRSNPAQFPGAMAQAVLWQLLFLGLLLVVTNSVGLNLQGPAARALMLAMLGTVFALAWPVPVNFFFIYTIVWMAIAPYHFSQRACALLLGLIALGWFGVLHVSRGDSDAAVQVLLILTFHIFALLSSVATLQSKQASERANALNRELTATQHLLAQASRESERTRIARNLHDLLGHHLTALSIHLQVASRISEGEVKTKLEQCHALSRLLLSDVREAVGNMREGSEVNFSDTLRLIVKDVPNLQIHLDIPPTLTIEDVNVAETLLRCVQEAITNTLRHAGATAIWIRLRQEPQAICLSISDDGSATAPLTPGNGLKGMRERVERLDGQFTLDASTTVAIDVRLPLASSLL